MVVMVGATPGELHEITVAWRQLHEHRTDRYTGDCAICQLPGPRAVANQAAALLVERGVPVVEKPTSAVERRQARLAIIARFRRHAKRQRGLR